MLTRIGIIFLIFSCGILSIDVDAFTNEIIRIDEYVIIDCGIAQYKTCDDKTLYRRNYRCENDRLDRVIEAHRNSPEGRVKFGPFDFDRAIGDWGRIKEKLAVEERKDPCPVVWELVTPENEGPYVLNYFEYFGIQSLCDSQRYNSMHWQLTEEQREAHRVKP